MIETIYSFVGFNNIPYQPQLLKDKHLHAYGSFSDTSIINLPFHQLSSSEVGSHGLVMLALHRKGMPIGNPCRAVSPLQGGGFANGDVQQQI